MSEPGLDLHEWETRWAELQELAAHSPDEALPEIVRAVAPGEVGCPDWPCGQNPGRKPASPDAPTAREA
jgi:hypothetical protein